jgi:DNA invertase Pin-like site-specific DNA recombinase
MAITEPTGRLIGYARVSTKPSKSRKRQHVDNQVARLYDAGCEVVFTDETSGKKASRPGWDRCLAYMRPGDLLLFTKLDRIGRSLHNLVEVVEDLGHRGVGLKSLDQGEIDTTTSHGRLLFGIMAAVAQFEADINRERTAEGLDAARERHGGTLPARGPSVTEDQITTAKMLARTTKMSAARIAEVIGVSRATLYRHVDIGAERQAA